MKWLVTFALAFSISQAQNRPQEHWVFRGVMRDKGRIIFMALHDQLSVAYETSNCGLYMSWDGGMEDSYNTYDHQDGGNHGATLDPRGSIMYWQHVEGSVSSSPINETRGNTHTTKNEPGIPVWQLAGQNAAIEYVSYVLSNNQNVATLKYRIPLNGGGQILITETPEAANNGNSLTREFNVTGVPGGQALTLKLDGSNVSGQSESWSVTGQGSIASNVLTLNNGATTVTGAW